MRRARVYVTMLTLGIGAELLLLHLGRDLQASHSVGGAWVLRIDSIAEGAACPSLQPGQTQAMAIAQSGAELDIAGPGAIKMQGRIEGRAVRATTSEQICSSPVTLSFTIDDRAPSAMRGAIELPATRPPTRASFTATRAPREARR